MVYWMNNMDHPRVLGIKHSLVILDQTRYFVEDLKYLETFTKTYTPFEIGYN